MRKNYPYHLFLELQMKTWKSKYYQHFKLPPEIIKTNGGAAHKYKFVCKKHP